MSEQNPYDQSQPVQPELTPPAESPPSLLSRPDETLGPPPAWMPSPPPAPKDSVWTRIAAFVVLVAVVAAVAGAGIGWSLARAVNNRPTAQATQNETPIQAVTPSTGSGNASADAVAAKVSPAIVDINTVLGNGQAAGTGMLISSTGEILTNNHVVNGSTSITVTVQGRSQKYSAHVVGVDISEDIAVIQIDGSVSGLPTVKFADSSSLQVGETVVALGNALGRGGAPNGTSGQTTA